MLDLTYLRDHPDEIRDSIRRRGVKVDYDRWLKLDQRRSELTPIVEGLRSQFKQTGKPTPETVAKLQALKEQLKDHEEEYSYIEAEWQRLREDIPNLIADDTPDGGEEANREERRVGRIEKFDFPAKDHIELNAKLNFVDFEAGVKVAGSRFYYLNDNASRLWDAMVILTKQVIRQHGFKLNMVPHMVSGEIAAGTGFLPRGEERQIYKVEDQDLNLIATAELPLTGRYKDSEINLTTENPNYLTAALTPCYRLEAGTYGKFAKGLFRVHQFEKLEMYAFSLPQASSDMLQKIVAIEEEICQLLEIPYRVVRTASGDLSGPAYQKYDLEYWSPSDNTWRELTSCSNCTDFQARRMNIRYRQPNGQLDFCHTLNGTAITSGRNLIAVIENHQTADGQVKLPASLAKLYGGEFL